MDLGYQRQAVAEWRDRQMTAAAALFNLKAIDARAAFDRDLHDATARDAFFPSALATTRIDALMTAALDQALPDFLSAAAQELVAISERLTTLSQGLGDAKLDLPSAASATLEAASAPASEETPPPPAATPPAAWLTDLPGRLRKQAAGVIDSAGAAADQLVTERLKLVDRLRTAAAKRIERAWMNDEAGHDPLSQLIGLIDETAHASRVSLS
ncbi:hypothetical protein [Brevundimonas pondensis]|uniref:Uncharacterized protein n=1 Tax=Brevundimonas pondensis TaxID=2774189 RepID=A0ABX7SME5_9CAUL|nr:hypothetical protein [Brevundimonas pondensis]QTC88693.1 hypothetical protein IFE19_04835 [Brevundimonas pondensis]